MGYWLRWKQLAARCCCTCLNDFDDSVGEFFDVLWLVGVISSVMVKLGDWDVSRAGAFSFSLGNLGRSLW